MEDEEEYWPRQIEAFAWLAEKAEKLGVTIGAEHMEPVNGHFFCGPADIRRLFAAIPSPWLGLTLDLAHAANWCRAIGGDLPSFVASAERLLHVHISDASPENHHLPLGEGDLDIAWMLSLLRARGYEGTVTIEGRARGRERGVIEANWRYLEKVRS